MGPNPVGHPESPIGLRVLQCGRVRMAHRMKNKKLKVSFSYKVFLSSFLLGNTKIRTHQQVDLELYVCVFSFFLIEL